MEELSRHEMAITTNPWQTLREYTDARIALGRCGAHTPLRESLNFNMAHAHARDAVYTSLDKDRLLAELEQAGYNAILLQSQAIARQEYLQRPDLGRKLSETSVQELTRFSKDLIVDVVFILADGLSAQAVNTHALPVMQTTEKLLAKQGITQLVSVLVEQGRVAISDEIGSILKAKVAVMLIGERPGLSAPDSMGAYLTYNPIPGLTDDSRNCVSNIRPQGLSYNDAAAKITWLITESLRRKISGVSLKENFTHSGFDKLH